MYNITLVVHYVEGFYSLLIILIYACIQSAFLWGTWLERFSGNANFFYLQSIPFHVSLTLLFIQLLNAIDAKRKKYAKEVIALHRD